MNRQPEVVVVLLNWNAWQETIACIASLLACEYPNLRIVVCDNASADDSWQQMYSWCVAKMADRCVIWQPGWNPQFAAKIVLIQTGSNLGFAGGCNVGIRYALQHTGCEYLWLLNNDTLVLPEAVALQVRCMQQENEPGLLGSTLVYADSPGTVQCFGGYGFNFWNARVRALPFGSNAGQRPAAGDVAARLHYVSGASTFVTRRFVEAVGLLNEQYFLYFEEIDWAVRGKSFRMTYCPDNIVLHKEGRSIGSAHSATQRSDVSERWLTRNRILFTRTYFPLRTIVTVVWVLAVATVRALTGRWQRGFLLVRSVLRGMAAPVLPLPQMSVWPASTIEAGARMKEAHSARTLPA